MQTVPSTPTDFNQSGMHTAPPEMKHPSKDSLQLLEHTPVATSEIISIRLLELFHAHHLDMM
jgi:hypothetical protein